LRHRAIDRKATSSLHLACKGLCVTSTQLTDQKIAARETSKRTVYNSRFSVSCVALFHDSRFALCLAQSNHQATMAKGKSGIHFLYSSRSLFRLLSGVRNHARHLLAFTISIGSPRDVSSAGCSIAGTCIGSSVDFLLTNNI
jgi:hypothetical protein